MRLEGKIWKSKTSKFWLIEVPLLDVVTQGTSKEDAFLMIKDAIELLVNKKGFKVQVFFGKGSDFSVESNNPKILIAFMLKRLRTLMGLSVRDVATRLNSKSPNAYAQYESGKVNLSLDKLVELIKAINPDFKPVLKA